LGELRPAHDDQDEVFLVTHGMLVVELPTGEVPVKRASCS
jgi:hypothetical protein